MLHRHHYDHPLILTVINALPPGRCSCNSKNLIFKLILQMDLMNICWEIALMWMPQNSLMISQNWFRLWLCRQATSHYLKQCRQDLYGIIKPQWFKLTSMEIMAWINNSIHVDLGDVIMHPYGNVPMGLTHWGRDKMAAISQTILSNTFSWMKMLQFDGNFTEVLFLGVQITIFYHWFR